MKKKMTYRDLLDLLPIVADQQWTTNQSPLGFGFIRNEKNQCPVCALVEALGEPGFKYAAISACKIINMPIAEQDIEQIMRAADYPNHPLRAELCYILGVTE